MANITAQQVKELRDKTGAGMADCKKALVEADGDMGVAIDELRKRGAASAEKRADRDTNEGVVATKVSDNGQKASIAQVTCETDFVARNEEFVNFVDSIATVVFDKSPNTKEDLLAADLNGNKVEDKYNEILAKFSEKIEVGKFEKIETPGYLVDYIHGGSKLGVVVEVSSPKINDEARLLVRDIAMQVAAMNPSFLDRTSVTQEILDKEKELYKQQATEEGKPADIAERIAEGRINKFYKENCLVEQQYVKDGNMTINDVLKQISNIVGEEVKINQFIRYAIGG
ncbi:MAG: translation elongation factor Ts [Candidatus Kapaibacterium sp.]|nr:elongation factor Ts [Ignavibacteriota bacterium]MCB9220228.1 elongation factor Ts [Ignavibacteria bacterium]